MQQIIPTIIFSIIPITYIIGPFALNLNILVVFLLAIKKVLNNKNLLTFELTDKIVLIFFLYLFITSFINSLDLFFNRETYFLDYTVLEKSIFYFRYFLLFYSIKVLITSKSINLNYMIWTSLIATSFVGFDLILQMWSGANILGQVSPYYEKLTGLFGEEAIAGGYLQKFSLIPILGIIFFFSNNNKLIKIFFLIIFISFICFTIIISGNRMPFLLFCLSLIIISLNFNLIKKNFIIISIIISLILFLTISLNTNTRNYYKILYNNSSDIIKLVTYRLTGIGENIPVEKRPSYINEFDDGIATWKMNKVFGGGVKSYRYNCTYREKTPDIIYRYRNEVDTFCNMHPHNYYLEILADLGIVGLILFLLILFNFIKLFKKIVKESIYRQYAYPYLFILLIEFFPIRSSGSIFTTNNSVIIFLSLGVILGASEISNFKNQGQSSIKM